MPPQGEQSSELFHVFSKLHKRGGVEDEKARTVSFFFPVGYLYTIPIPATNKFLKGPLDLGEFMRWVGFWIYMAFWVGVSDSSD